MSNWVNQHARQVLIDTVGLGFLVWLIGYAMGFVIITLPGYPDVMQQPAVLAVFGTVMAVVTGGLAFWRFRGRRGATWGYACGVGASWLAVAVVCDFVFIVLLFGAWNYYRLDIAVYYAVTLVAPAIGAKVAGKT